MEHTHKVYCFHCGTRYDQVTREAPRCCGVCGSAHVGVFSDAWPAPVMDRALAVVEGTVR